MRAVVGKQVCSSINPELLLSAALMDDESDDDLMARYCDGDFKAFEMLYNRHSRRLYRYIAWQTTRKDLVDEVIQDAWLRLHHARASYRAGGGFKTFLYTIAHNRLIDLLRQQRMVLESELNNNDDASVFEQMVEQHTQAVFPAMNNEQDEKLYQAINALPKEQREALVAQQFSGLTLHEIALLTGVSIETVKSRLRYAMKKLRQTLTVEIGVALL
ncbi:sigma-70 family RNA polymerase sigma factor [Methylotenera sp. G11]|uniref:sigma-70 family RNA polymerase sigma factor n=1 Tax=Methylotenera sp. G11 TaxID=1506585 RepID=UPI000AD47A8C|nr:sigma-70 family RNA polymerase sigma factor [Methylotenera sp. G11]